MSDGGADGGGSSRVGGGNSVVGGGGKSGGSTVGRGVGGLQPLRTALYTIIISLQNSLS